MHFINANENAQLCRLTVVGLVLPFISMLWEEKKKRGTLVRNGSMPIQVDLSIQE